MNRRGARLWALLGAGCFLAASTAEAQEQPWLKDRKFTYGPGIQGERFEYSGGVAAALTYDSNVFLRADTAAEPRADAFRLSITPFVGVTSKAPQNGQKAPYTLSANLALSYYEF